MKLVGVDRPCIADTLTAVLSDDEAKQSHAALTGAMHQILDAGAASNVLRTGVPPEDVLALLSTLLRVAPTTEGKAQRERLIALILTGVTV